MTHSNRATSYPAGWRTCIRLEGAPGERSMGVANIAEPLPASTTSYGVTRREHLQRISITLPLLHNHSQVSISQASAGWGPVLLYRATLQIGTSHIIIFSRLSVEFTFFMCWDLSSVGWDDSILYLSRSSARSFNVVQVNFTAHAACTSDLGGKTTDKSKQESWMDRMRNLRTRSALIAHLLCMSSVSIWQRILK